MAGGIATGVDFSGRVAGMTQRILIWIKFSGLPEPLWQALDPDHGCRGLCVVCCRRSAVIACVSR
jgi:hypothetical protein